MTRQPRKLSDEEERALAAVPQPCGAFCADHQRGCNVTGEHQTAHGWLLHTCGYGQWGHDFLQVQGEMQGVAGPTDDGGDAS